MGEQSSCPESAVRAYKTPADEDFPIPVEAPVDGDVDGDLNGVPNEDVLIWISPALRQRVLRAGRKEDFRCSLSS